ncbi:MAG: OmpH family outer membrane protein [Phycisphaerales bacterium]|nr:OmpH family outer membrane protein [Phycisphaerales bacterium]
MKTERLIAVTALVVAVLALLSNLGSTQSAVATLDDDPERVGPADELVLSGDEPLVIRNRENRIGWGDRPTSRAWSFGAVHIDRVIQSLLQSDAYVGERDELQQELVEMDEEFTARGEALQEEYADITEEDPNFPEAQQRMQAMMQEYQQFAQIAQGRMSQLQTMQLERGYREMIEAVEVISDKRELDMVLRFIPTAEPFGTNAVEQAMLQIRLRTLLRYPDSIDITEDVLEELSLEG